MRMQIKFTRDQIPTDISIRHNIASLAMIPNQTKPNTMDGCARGVCIWHTLALVIHTAELVRLADSMDASAESIAMEAYGKRHVRASVRVEALTLARRVRMARRR